MYSTRTLPPFSYWYFSNYQDKHSFVNFHGDILADSCNLKKNAFENWSSQCMLTKPFTDNKTGLKVKL